ncbi:MAG: primosomal protein N' [Nitrospirae bacterium]|nr:primosomal protein N' [Nitrospirota bacterium]
MRGRLVPGSRVLVPFGSRRITGTVIGFPGKAEVAGLKTVIEVLDNPLPTELFALARWMSDYYLHPLGQTIEALVPKALSRAKPKKKRYLQIVAGDHDMGSVRGPKQRALLLLLCDRQIMGMDDLDDYSPATIRSLCDAKIATIIEKEADEKPDAGEFSPSVPPGLMPAQSEAVRRINESVAGKSFNVFLLHGVTGSGKTEVYLHAISGLADTGKGAIVLVPEIALTPQLLARFKGRFGDRVAVLHSGLTDRERADEYRRIQAGQVDVAIGARSAVFAPFKSIGLIIVDEEHENSYKQDEGLRYSARDVAIMRAKLLDAVAVLGSATPSLESYYNARSGKYQYLHLADRVDHRPMPAVTVIDVKTLPRTSLYSPLLIEHITQRLARNEQSLLLLNRRGFSSVLICGDCGIAVKCPSCSVSLTFHKAERTLKCHYCGFLTRPPDTCPACSGLTMKLLGSGTQKIEEELQALFPAARILRMDSDSVKGRQAYETLLRKVDRREVDILLGTQMIAKGHDFPAVTLVGVVDADVGLNLPDFRAAEKTFQLVTQAAGRAGRGALGGEVIIQTMNPNHYSVQHSMTHDYEGFYNEEIVYRTQLGYPPIGRFIKIEIKGAQESLAGEAARTAQNRIRSLMRGKDTVLLGPAPAPISRVRGQYRFHLLLLSQKRDKIRSLAIEGRNAVEEKYGRRVKVIVDVDPVNLM